DPTRFGEVHENSADIIAHAHVLNLDHHMTNGYFGEVNLVDPMAAAVGELVFALLQQLRVPVDLSIAINLLTALVTDTRCFRTASTTPSTLAIAAELSAAGAPLSTIVQSVYYNRTPSMLRVWGMALARMQLSDGIAWTVITREMQIQAGAAPTEGDGVVDLMSSMGQVQAVAVFRETDGGIKVSLRATDGYNVAAAAAHFGGGGHPRAAGCLLPGPIDEAERLVVSYLTNGTASR
ncbi:MAG: DHH family phosphoesterase, partial [Chloroflexota bacterium]